MNFINIKNHEYLVAEYIWIDAYNKLRSKCRTLYTKFPPEKLYLKDLPDWNFDGSSTGQASPNNSEVIIKPCSIFKDPFKKYSILVLCDCYDLLDNPLPSNNRYNAMIIFNSDKVIKSHPWYGIEQEYVVYNNKTNKPLGWPILGNPPDQGDYYCGIGSKNIFGRDVIDEHYKLCLECNINISGTNAEVMPGQWEYQIGPSEGIHAADELWIARYIMEKICEKYNYSISLDPKPVKGNWNGSGCHINYSTNNMRNDYGMEDILQAIKKLESKHEEHIAIYGDNSERLSGTHETSSINTFSYGVADRTASVRIPFFVNRDGKGYLEDRRPASDIDPYQVLSKIAETTIL